MIESPVKIFLVDTNIWLDYFIPQRTKHRDAVDFFTLTARKQYELAYAVHAMKDVGYMISSTMKQLARSEGADPDPAIIREISYACIQAMGEVATAVAADASDVWLAQKYYKIHPDLEDDFVIVAAKRAGATCIVTSDAKLLGRSPVAAMTAADAIAFINAGE